VMADNMGRVMRFRDEHPEFADRFIDVHYQDLITKPVATLQTLYDRMGLRLSNATADSIQRLASNRGRYGLHRNGHPPLSELGLDPQVEAQRFGEYCSRFGIKPTAV